MNKRIFVSITIWLVAVIVIMTTFHYPIVNRALYEKSLGNVQTAGSKLEQNIALMFREMELDIESFSKSMNTDEKWLDKAIAFLSNHQNVQEIHYYDENRVHSKVQLQRDVTQLLDKVSIEGMFFYQPLIVESYDNTRSLVYYKGSNHYLLFLVDFSKMFEPFLSGLNGMQGIYDQHLVPLVEVGDQLNSRAFFNKSESDGSDNGYLSAVFYDVGNVSIGNKTYYTLLLKFDQTYKRAIRLYMTRLFIISILLLILGFLVAWRIVKKFRQAVVGKKLGSVPELIEIKKNITLAIEHMNVAAKSYDDISILKEELEVLYSDLDEEGVENEKD